MCLPLGMLKCYSIAGAIFTLVAGINLLAILIYANVISGRVWIQEIDGQRTLVFVFVWIIDALIIITACLGLVGIKKGKPFLLFLFTILVGISSVVLIIGGVLAVKAPDVMLDNSLCTNSNSTFTSDNQWFKDFMILEGGAVLFCTPACPCRLSNLENYTLAERSQIQSFYIGRDGTAVQIQSCQEFKNAVSVVGSDKILTYMSGLGAIQEYFGCTGWCGSLYPTDNYFYKFSNIANGMPHGYCEASLKDWVIKWANAVAYTCFAVAAALFIVLVFNICICFHPQRRTKRITERFYDPAVNTDYIRQE